MASTVPFVLEVQGHAVIPLPAERAHIDVHIASSGPDKAKVSSEVLSSARVIEALLYDLSPEDESAEAKASAALAHWSKTSLSATSHRPYDNEGNQKDREYTARINFDIRFQDFKALGGFGAHISALPHVELPNIEWKLKPVTEYNFRAQLRKKAAEDAFRKAQDYCEVFGCVNLQPVALGEGHRSLGSMGNVEGAIDFDQDEGGGYSFGGARGKSGRTRQTARKADVEVDEPAFEFTPQEVTMEMSVTVKFKAE
jgi:hypothetical protein